MPRVGGQKFAYTRAGKAKAAKALRKATKKTGGKLAGKLVGSARPRRGTGGGQTEAERAAKERNKRQRRASAARSKQQRIKRARRTR